MNQPPPILRDDGPEPIIGYYRRVPVIARGTKALKALQPQPERPVIMSEKQPELLTRWEDSDWFAEWLKLARHSQYASAQPDKHCRQDL